MPQEGPEGFKDGFAPILVIAFGLLIFGLSVSNAYQGFVEGEVRPIHKRAFRLVTWAEEPFNFAFSLGVWSLIALFSGVTIFWVVRKILKEDT